MKIKETDTMKIPMKIPMLDRVDLERLMASVDQSEDCWFWEGERNGDYQPVLEITGVKYHPGDLLYVDLCGPLEDGEKVTNKCFTVGCINPKHKEGVWRAQHGKLRKGDVIRILDSGKTVRELAEEFDVCLATIYNIRSGKVWKDITPQHKRKRPVPKPPRQKHIRTAFPGITFDLGTGKYIASYYRKYIGEYDSREEAVVMRVKHIEDGFQYGSQF